MSEPQENAAVADTGGKAPRTERGRRTLRKLLDAAAREFGERGFHESSVSSITRRAEVALGTFYTYFDSKEALFSALVADLSEQVKKSAAGAIETVQEKPAHSPLDIEEAALAGFLRFAREHKEIYRIIDEAEFVDPAAFRNHYEGVAQRIAARLTTAQSNGRLSPGDAEAQAWALMGMNVFLGLRYAVWGKDRSPEEIAGIARGILAQGVLREDD